MKIALDKEALNWFKREFDLNRGDTVRFFARYGGETTIHPGFSLGVSLDSPVKAAVSTELDGILFYVENEDVWYLDGQDLMVLFDEPDDSIAYIVGTMASNLLLDYVDA